MGEQTLPMIKTVTQDFMPVFPVDHIPKVTMIDLCHWSTKTTVYCDKISVDGYEVENLISRSIQKKQNGYLSERFIKPPINITFCFPCPVTIWRIVVDPVIGSQKTSSIGIYTTSTGISPTGISRSEISSSGISPSGVSLTRKSSCVDSVDKGQMTNRLHTRLNSGHSSSNTQSISDKSVSCFPSSRRPETCVGKITMRSSSKMCFYDPQFKPRFPYSTSNFIQLNHYEHVSPLRHIRQVYCANHITIRICQTLGGSVGAVKSVQIWGQPAPSCSKTLETEIYTKFQTEISKAAFDSCLEKLPNTSVKSLPTEKINNVNPNSVNLCIERRQRSHTEIPEDFLDTISCDIMTIPMLLPCGRNIDKSSLDRFVNVEATWGRQPSDPFTGVAFTADSFPIPNDALKGRIDHFLLKNGSSMNIQALPRTVSTLYEKKSTEKRNSYPRTVSAQKTKNLQSLPKTVSGQTTEKRKCIENKNSDSQSKKLKYTECLGTNNVSNKLCTNTGNASTSKDNLKLNSQTGNSSAPIDNLESNNSDQRDLRSHETSLQLSLNSALCDVLGNFPSFRKPKQTAAIKSKDLDCNKCEKTFSLNQLKYSLLCDHLICRDCLTTEVLSNQICCSICDTITMKSDVTRLYK